MKKFFFDCGTRDATASLGLFFLRVGMGLLMLFGHGWKKVMGFSEMKDKFSVPDFFPLKYMSPPVSLMAVISAEAICSVLIIVGLATRPAAFILAFTMVVAAFHIHGSGPWFLGEGPGPKEPALLYLVPFVAILLAGAGSFSLDASLLKEGRRRSKW